MPSSACKKKKEPRHELKAIRQETKTDRHSSDVDFQSCPVPSPIICRVQLFFFNDSATTEIYTLSLHDALPICSPAYRPFVSRRASCASLSASLPCVWRADRKSTRLNSSHTVISYAVFCLK